MSGRGAEESRSLSASALDRWPRTMEDTKSPTVHFLSLSRWQVAPMESYLPILCMCTNVR